MPIFLGAKHLSRLRQSNHCFSLIDVTIADKLYNIYIPCQNAAKLKDPVVYVRFLFS